MSKNLENKKQIVSEVAQMLEETNPTTVVVDYTGISSNQMNELRDKLFEKNASLKIIKNTLIAKVLDMKGVKLDGNQKESLNGQSALLIVKDDVIEAVKSLYDFIKVSDKGSVKFGVLDGQILDTDKVKQLSKLPGRHELLGQIVGTLVAPIRGFEYALKDTQSKFVRVLSAVKDSKEN